MAAVYSDKVKDILSYIERNPVNIKSEKMFYIATSKLDKSRLPDVVEDLRPEDVIVDRFEGTRINRPSLSKAEKHSSRVQIAMLYLATGGMDEAHNIVLPYRY